ncbi:MAG: elongation factor P [Candidatus Dependentiae bacterium]|nr:elongation factor P [Candidatus Dependentiae bacterium]
MLAASDCKKGAKVLYKNEPHVVVEYQHTKPGKGPAFVRLKLKNLITGSAFESTFRTEEKFEEPSLAYRTMVYLYNDGSHYVFMDQESYDQADLDPETVGDVKLYLREQVPYTMLYWNDRVIGITPPIHMEFEVVETPPGVKGDTAQGSGTKPATLDTGLVVQVPLFVNSGDFIKVDTRDGQYIERVKK